MRYSICQAVSQAQKYLRAGARWVVDLDLEKCFARVNPDQLLSEGEKRIRDKRGIPLSRRDLKGGLLAAGLGVAVEEGTPQGGVRSPLLSHRLLDHLAREWERRGQRVGRAADEANLYGKSARAGRGVKERVSRFLTRKLRLPGNGEKRAGARPGERKFLGVPVTTGGKPTRRRALQALPRFKARLRAHPRRRRGSSLARRRRELRPYLGGGRTYFGVCAVRAILKAWAAWSRRRLRGRLWQQGGVAATGNAAREE